MYKIFGVNSVVRLADNASIPNDPANTDYAEYLEWAKTNTAAPQFTPAEIAKNAKVANNTPILATLAANDIKIVRALTEGDTVRINQHLSAQAALRAQLQ